MISIPFNDWCDESTCMEALALMHNLSPKHDVIVMLKKEFDRLTADQSLGLYRKWYQVALSMQIFALALELTDDLASVCEAYSESIRNHDKRVVERIAYHTREDCNEFYNCVSQFGDSAVEALGLDPADCPLHLKEYWRNEFGKIKKTRDHFWKWYNAYKHGQYAMPIHASRGTSEEKWGVYLIPKKFCRNDRNMVHTQGEERFIDTVRYVEEFVELANEVRNLSNDARKLQYPKVFGKPLTT